ncbi:uncharacterized protein TNCV_2027471 [Trichonephila clavipes]|nr:uncharacterized protein TNCV_2027471 [Trichonephila clavipes]
MGTNVNNYSPVNRAPITKKGLRKDFDAKASLELATPVLLTMAVYTVLSLSWHYFPRLTPEQLFQIVQFYFESNGSVRNFHKRILFSDEAHFWLNGYVNKQNCRIWSEANPQVYVETSLHPEKLTVWCALWAGGILQKR